MGLSYGLFLTFAYETFRKILDVGDAPLSPFYSSESGFDGFYLAQASLKLIITCLIAQMAPYLRDHFFATDPLYLFGHCAAAGL